MAKSQPRKQVTVYKPGGLTRRERRLGSIAAWPAGDPEAVRPLQRGEGYPLFAAGVVLAFFALLVCYSKSYLLLYGDAVAHLGIARRIVDARYPGLAQLGGVWLPLPHLLILPFISKMSLWQTGMAAAPMSILSFAASVAGVWRLARRLMRLRWALVATAFYALNPNLLYLATTAMTEALFLALLVWTVVMTVEGVAALRAANVHAARMRMLGAGLLVLGQVFTRYDGWIVGAAVWLCFAIAVWRAAKEVRSKVLGAFVVFTVLCAVGPLLWFWYNAHFEGDWLDFMRGPYSAKVIERKTAPPGQHYRGWHNMGWAALFYTRTAQIDAAAWETGFAVMAAALYGLWLSWKRRVTAEARSRADALALLLWVPLPFYIYSVAYGSVPIFIPQLWPHSFYNARYGMELLPALAIYGALAGERLDVWLATQAAAWARIAARFWQPVAMMLCVANCIVMMYFIPLVLKEGIVNATTRVPFEHALAVAMEQMPPDQPIMMSVSAHVGAVQVAGRNLRGMVSENDEQLWERGLADPADNAAFVIAMKGDPVEAAVKAHPAGLTELSVICSSGQPCARVYQSDRWNSGQSGR
ncbi:MAG TPA: hypothetical protein VGN16_03225 [Acidobacteriaceae bacterium]|jgi:hypothetical protein